MVKCADSQKYLPNMLQVITRDFFIDLFNKIWV